jgi:hypothetical protein
VKDEHNTALSYTPRPDITPDSELDALAAVYRFILFESSANKKGGPETAPDDAEESKNDRTDTASIHK